MKIVFVRHGESEANVAGLINDDPGRPVALTPRGHAQAEAVAELLRGRPFVRAYASGFARAQRTAAAILAHHRCELRIDARLNERRSGMDGEPTSSFNELVRSDPARIKPPQGESFLEQMERLRGFLDAAAACAPDGMVLAVSHENPILAARAVTGLSPDEAVRGSVPNCGIVELDWPPA